MPFASPRPEPGIETIKNRLQLTAAAPDNRPVQQGELFQPRRCFLLFHDDIAKAKAPGILPDELHRLRIALYRIDRSIANRPGRLNGKRACPGADISDDIARHCRQLRHCQDTDLPLCHGNLAPQEFIVR